MGLAAHPRAKIWLGVISFIESSFFPIPADIMFIPMALAKREEAIKLAFIATVTSVLGGVFGYFIGMYAYEALAMPMLESLGKLEGFAHYRDVIKGDIFVLWGLLLSSGLTHIPPIKIVTILSGVAGVSLPVFIISAIIGRGARFFLLGYLLYRYGEGIQDFIEKRLNLISIGFILLIALIYIVVKLF
ncbi:MAG: YqaA family protein [Pseudomonadota bacterium]